VDPRLSLRPLSLAEAQHKMDSGTLYGTIVIPQNLSEGLGALVPTAMGQASPNPPVRPTVALLTNPRAGSLGVSLFTGVAGPALGAASTRIGTALTAQVADPSVLSAADRILLANPLAVVVTPYHPLPGRAGLGLSAFYYTLLIILAGYLGATLISSSIDSALGHAPTEIGLVLHQRAPVRISRVQALLAKCVVSVVLAPIAAGAVLLATSVILGMDTPHALQLWAFSTYAIAAVAIGAQALIAAFGMLGQLLGMFVFVALALPSSGGTVPLQALPAFYRFLSNFEPARQLVDGTRAILYFDARADAGLARAWLMATLGLLLGLAFGFAVTRIYDRRGISRFRTGPSTADTGT
jgi:ABC-type polysaccharide/polyol phosphate export permease